MSKTLLTRLAKLERANSQTQGVRYVISRVPLTGDPEEDARALEAERNETHRNAMTVEEWEATYCRQEPMQ